VRKPIASHTRIFRCAIYTRKSSEEGLEQDFNSLHAQRESCAAYITSLPFPPSTMTADIPGDRRNGRLSKGCWPISNPT
jgi:site-specific DNA recombinase